MPVNDKPKVAIVILNWNGLGDTLDCIESVSKQEYGNFLIILVDNGSTDGSPAIVRQRYPAVTIIVNHTNTGFSMGNNMGIRKACQLGADYVWLLNNDTIVEPDTLARLVDASTGSPDVGMISPAIHYHDEPDKVQFCGSHIDWDRKSIIQSDDWAKCAKNRDISLWGTALLIRRDVIERVGYLNEKYFAYHEDEEYSMRVARAGYRSIVEPGARIFHKNSRSTGSNDAPLQVFLRSRNIFFLWMDQLGESERRAYRWRYVAHIISYGGLLKEKNLPDSVSACLDGMWCAIRGIGGPRDPSIRAPRPLKTVMNLLISWHPYFWANLFRGNLSGIYFDVKNRLNPFSASR
jgi:GT2 family glycosyltransferase